LSSKNVSHLNAQYKQFRFIYHVYHDYTNGFLRPLEWRAAMG